MRHGAVCSLTLVPTILAGSALVGLAPIVSPVSPGLKTVAAAPALLADEDYPGMALLMGGSGVPIPPMRLVQKAFDNYIATNGYADYGVKRIFTPEGLNPIFTPPKSLPLDPSVAQGVTILNDSIKAELEAGRNVAVGGVSQSATIASLEMQNIVNESLGFQPDTDQLAFFMVGNPSNPNGGLLSRFDVPVGFQPTIPSLGLTFTGATPADTGFDTHIWTGEYDGIADFPRYPLNILSNINAFLGILYVHGEYFKLDQSEIDNAIELPTSEGYDGGTHYYVIPTEFLPLVEPLRGIPFIGDAMADLLAPSLRVLVNLGYGSDPTIGWSDGPADVATPIGLFPELGSDDLGIIWQALVDGVQTGIHDAIDQLSDPANWALPVGESAGTGSFDLADLPSFLEVVNAFSGAASLAYQTLLPTADILNALTTSLPAFGLSLFTHYLEEGDLLNAIGMPLAAGAGLTTLAAGIEFMVMAQASNSIQDIFDDLF
ncbi:MAG: PE-PPE domain-containing protein [Mycobacterium sp.]